MSSARVRHTFRFPADDARDGRAGDDDDDDVPAVMDEQEQESFIARLAAQNRQRNEQFGRLLLALPATASIPFAAGAVLRLAAAPPPLLSLLALSSLAATAFLTMRLPPARTGFAVLDRRLGGTTTAAAPRSPLETFLPYLNAGLCAVVAALGVLGRYRAAAAAAEPTAWELVLGLGSLPALVFAVVVVAKVVMAGVDPERELDALRYEYKGA
ncbi:hypothetical protein B0T24DRAFT_621413 [Lasiosphaeria ovina]|uniref:Uncharacterized protein n=1 Tax=Lasiosphaeria ovina TaxID=92902 RepID=A0AAE0KBF3_9PEZI|nr:hypothetical protein B0T24DRAFT_621413 [Lasiosphaeria ovina]